MYQKCKFLCLTMKLFVVILLAAIVATACAESEEVLDEVEKKCREKTGVTSQELAKATGKKDEKQNIKCLTACRYEEDGVINADGSINVDKGAEPFAENAEWVEAFKQCAAEASMRDNKCDVAHDLVMCLSEKLDSDEGDN